MYTKLYDASIIARETDAENKMLKTVKQDSYGVFLPKTKEL